MKSNVELRMDGPYGLTKLLALETRAIELPDKEAAARDAVKLQNWCNDKATKHDALWVFVSDMAKDLFQYASSSSSSSSPSHSTS